jgi:hypothetical protein
MKHASSSSRLSGSSSPRSTSSKKSSIRLSPSLKKEAKKAKFLIKELSQKLRKTTSPSIKKILASKISQEKNRLSAIFYLIVVIPYEKYSSCI